MEMIELARKFKNELNNGNYQFGMFLKSADPMFVEVCGLAGFDYVILDTEHGPTDIEHQQNNIRAAVLRGTLPIVRVSELDENVIGKALDIGAGGVQIPQIRCAEDAYKAVQFSRFHPYGKRGVCRFVRAANYAYTDRNEYFEQSKDLIIIIHLEGKEAIDNLDEILDVDGIDVLFIGPYDLSQAFGIPGQVDNPIIISAMRDIIEKARKKGKVVGTFIDTEEQLVRWKEAGVQYLNYLDIDVFKKACDSLLKLSRR